MEIVKVESPNEFTLIFFPDKMISECPEAQSIRWLMNKKLGLKRLGKLGVSIANKLLYFEEISECWIAKTWFSVTIKYGRESELDELKEKIKKLLKTS